MNEEEQDKRIEFLEKSLKSLPDHFEVTVGTPSKGTQVTLKTYYNSLEIDEAQKRIENTLKIRQFLLDKGIIQ